MKSSSLLIQLFLQLLIERGLAYDAPDLDGGLLRDLVATTLPGEDIDRHYVVEFILSRQHRLGLGLLELKQERGTLKME